MSPIFYVIDEDSGNGLDKHKDFHFTYTPTLADCEVEWQFKFSVNGTEHTTGEFANIIYTHASGIDPILKIETQDVAYIGLHDVQIWAEVVDSSPLVSSKDWTVSDPSGGPITIDFQILMYNHFCLYGKIQPLSLSDMSFTI